MKGQRVNGFFDPSNPIKGTITHLDETNGEAVITWDAEPGYRPQMGFFQIEHIGPGQIVQPEGSK